MTGPQQPPSSGTIAHERGGPGLTGYVISLIAGFLVIALVVVTNTRTVVIEGNAPSMIAVVLGIPAATGILLAIIGMTSRPRRFRTAALILTVLPALFVLLVGALFVAVLVLFVSHMNP